MADMKLKIESTPLVPAVDAGRDHALGSPDAEMTLVEYGSYACRHCHVVHEVIAGLRNRFGGRMRYVFRHRPLPGSAEALRAAELAEYAAITANKFWDVHAALMERGPQFSEAEFQSVMQQFGLPPIEENAEAYAAAQARVREDMKSAERSGVRVTPSFFIDGKQYTGTWDESSLADALLEPLGHRIQTAAFDFVRWGPASGLLLGLATVAALVLSNSPWGPAFLAFWDTHVGVSWGGKAFDHSLLHWVNHGLLTVFFFVVGLEIKREFTVGHLSTFRSGALPVIAALGGIILPAAIYSIIAPPGLKHAWGIPIGTDTAFAVALIVLLRDRVPIELRVFLTAAVIIDDVVAILVIAVFYTEEIRIGMLIGGGAVTALVAVLNRLGVYQSLPYAVCAVVLWFLLHEAGLHATLAAVIMAMFIPTRPPANVKALLAQANAIIQLEESQAGEAMRRGPSAPALATLDAIYRRMESPADKLLRSVSPWSSYVALPIFALANAGVVWSSDVFEGHGRLIAAVVLGLVIGKPVGIIMASLLAVHSKIAIKPDAYSWRQLCGAGALGGIGFTMSLFIASIAFSDESVFAASKMGIFFASVIAATLGVVILCKRPAVSG